VFHDVIYFGRHSATMPLYYGKGKGKAIPVQAVG